MSKKSQTTGMPKEPSKKPGEAEVTEGKAKEKPQLKREYRSRAEREQDIQRWVILGTAIAVAVVVVILGASILIDQVITPNQVVATVEGKNITVSDFQRQVRLQRALLNSRLSNVISTYRSFGFPDDQISQQLQSQEPFSTWIQQLQVPDQMGLAVIDQMVEDQLVRNEAAARGISVSAEDVDKQIEDFFGFTPEAASAEATAEATGEATAEATAEFTPTPTLTPTPYVSPTPSPTPTTAPPTATLELSPTPTTTPVATLPATATLTADQQAQQFQDTKNSYFADLRSQTGLSDNDIRAYFELQALRKALQNSITTEITKTGVFVDARHILVDTEEEAQDVMTALQAGESFADLAKAVSKDTGSGAQGGELGWAPVTQYVKEFQDAVTTGEIGAIIGPIKSEFGYHIIQIRSREDRDLDDTQFSQAQDNAFSTFLKDLKEAKKDQIQQSSIWANYVPTEPASIFG